MTANVPLDVVQKLPKDLDTGVYFGWANVNNGDVYKAVLSIGWNPFYDNAEKSMVGAMNFVKFCDKDLPNILALAGIAIILSCYRTSFVAKN